MKQAKQNIKFNFWKDNEISGHFTLSLHEFADKFLEYCKTKSTTWLQSYGTEQSILAFISDKHDGLGSTCNSDNNFEEIKILAKLLKDSFWFIADPPNTNQ